MESTKQKYDWPLIKQEFFISDYVEVKTFLRNNTGIIREQFVQILRGGAKRKSNSFKTS